MLQARGFFLFVCVQAFFLLNLFLVPVTGLRLIEGEMELWKHSYLYQNYAILSKL